jgi:hypothetical protein
VAPGQPLDLEAQRLEGVAVALGGGGEGLDDGRCP